MKLKLEEEKKGKKLIDFKKSIFKESITESKMFPSRKKLKDVKTQIKEILKSTNTYTPNFKKNKDQYFLSKSMIVEDSKKKLNKVSS